MKRLLLVVTLFMGLFGVVAHVADADVPRSVIYGQDDQAQSMAIPSRLCADTQSVVRLQADAFDGWGNRLYMPANAFLWRLTLSDGRWVIWDARVSWGYGPFVRGEEANSVYLSIPKGLGANAILEAQTPGSAPFAMILQDPDTSSTGGAKCEFAHASIYVSGGPKP